MFKGQYNFVKIRLYGIKLLHAKVQCAYIVHAKYDGFSTGWYKLISSCMHYLSTNKILFKKQSIKKIAQFKMLSFCQKLILWHQTSSCKCSMCLHCVCKVSDGFSIGFPAA